ncbi:hypothetical protein JDV02_008126 [Purpureocillium takamizusanense]|uniref:Peptidase S33 tripeptidyl aminopeptidase-like C-terminal domain-containing protein n=1 Tax=Purpureocillium takamizusanense TaxID=2060973 RepID=A0A9Q8VEV7_9HYPO|nr:uncharacterized protein JDV02_008126 [Purpureocillium takamizusanense]UNI22217.1 hypothetical protein JDV02_008126 [Purpureocillium takamizusanense]
MMPVSSPTSMLAVVCLLAHRAVGSNAFNWSHIEPSWDLQYTPCYDGLQCARLLLPLDWLNSSDGNNGTVAIAIAKLPAKVGADHDRYGGTVITNPGGPGDSGVVHMIKNGRYLQGMVDGNRHYDVLSFDPRGVFYSTPTANCYEDEPDGNLAEWQMRGFGLLDGSKQQLRRRRAHATARGQRCAQADKGQSSIREFMSTASVARDMLAIVDKIEESRSAALVKAPKSGHRDDAQRLELRSSVDMGAEARLQYFGTSYGTFLGNTFLSMFPGRVHRMVLDGLVVGEEYVDLEWSTNLADTAHVVDYFYQSCFEAGPFCPLWRAFDMSWTTIKSRVDKLVADLDDNPRAIANTDGPETVITGDEIRIAMMDPLYAPLDLFDGLATLLHDALQGNYTLLLERTGITGSKKDACSPVRSLEYSWMDQASMAVRCGDAKDVTDRDLTFWEAYAQKLKGLSPDIGGLWAEVPFACSGWQTRPKYRFDGPFESPRPDETIRSGRPSAPLLLLSSLYDPVTPLRSAAKVARGHPGSRVLLQKSVGHCAFLSSPSECTKRYVRDYMETGRVPPEGTECEPDCAPWWPCPMDRAHLPR